MKANQDLIIPWPAPESNGGHVRAGGEDRRGLCATDRGGREPLKQKAYDKQGYLQYTPPSPPVGDIRRHHNGVLLPQLRKRAGAHHAVFWVAASVILNYIGMRIASKQNIHTKVESKKHHISILFFSFFYLFIY